MDLTNIDKRFNENKLVILECLVDFYGEEYRYTILERFKHIYFNFSSVPTEEYLYILRNTKKLSISSLNPILKNYDQYTQVVNKYENQYCKIIKDYLNENFRIEIENKDVKEILNKEITLNKIEKMLLSFGCDKEKILRKKLENCLEYCLDIQKQYRNQIVKEAEFSLQMKRDIKKQFSLDLSGDVLRILAFKTNPSAGNFYTSKESTIPLGTFIRIPVATLLNRGIKSLDVCLIHEIIHKIETCGNHVGIAIEDKKSTNKIINEIRTQKIAIQITKRLHENGIFIFDNPKEHSFYNDSKYEILFPLTGNLLEEYEPFFNKCAMKSTSHLLELKFSKTWNFYATYLNEVYKYVLKNKKYNEQIYVNCMQALEDINDYVNQATKK